MRNCLGIEIGHYRIKIAYAENGELREFISERVEGIDRNDMRQYADLIKDQGRGRGEGFCDGVMEYPSEHCDSVDHITFRRTYRADSGTSGISV